VAAAWGLAVLAGLAEAAPGGTSTALAATPAPLTLTLSTSKTHYAVGEPVPLTATVTNATGAPCGLAAHPDAALRVVGMTANGKPVTPVFGRAFYDGGLASAVRGALHAIRPGGSVEVTRTVQTLEAGTDRLLLLDVEPLPEGDAIVSMWPLDGPGRYEAALRYEVPRVDATPTVCAGSSDVVSVAFTVGAASAPSGTPSAGGVPWAALVAAAVLMTGAVLVAWLLARRRLARGARLDRSVATVAVVTLLAAGITAGWPARADLIILRHPPGFDDQVNACLDTLRRANHTPETRRVIDWAERDDTPPIIVRHTDGGSNTFDTPRSPSGPGSSTVVWNPSPGGTYEDGVPRDPCTSLFHELVHAMRFGDRSAAPARTLCGATGIQREEVLATLLENAYRAANGQPPRTQYDGHPLPSDLSACDAPAPEPSPGPVRIGGNPRPERFCEDGCAESTGDPHLTTFDGVRYSPQAVGELVLVEPVAGANTGLPDLVVQARQRPLGPSRKVSVNSAVAVRVGADRVTLTLEPGGVIVRHEGRVVASERGRRSLPDGGTVERGQSSRRWAPDSVWVTWPDGSAVQVDPIGASGLRLAVRLSAGRQGAVRGLLGNFDGSQDGDLVTRDGAPITDLEDRTQLYERLVESWRVSDEESLFDYGPGENTGTFTDRSFPDAVVTAEDLAPEARERAAAVCGFAGVVDSSLLEDCVLDVAVSGIAAFAAVAGESQRDLGARRPPEESGGTGPTLVFTDSTTTVPLDGDRATVDLTAPGAAGHVTFDASAGQVVYVAFSGGTLPNGCGTVRLLSPRGVTLRTGCLTAGTGELDRTVLTDAGQYTVAVEPAGGATGRVSLRVVTAVDDEQTGGLGGPPVSVSVRQPGAQGRVVFEAAAGQKVFVQVDPVPGAAPVPNQCGGLSLRGPGNRTVRSGCLDGGAGDLEGPAFAEPGRYSVVIDPAAAGTGTVQVRLVAVEDPRERLSLGGPAVTARIEQPGAVARLAFTGTAGQRVAIQLTQATLPDGCGGVRVLGPAGREVSSGCLRGGNGELAFTPRATGEHTVLIDPRARATGTVDVRVREE
jgi:hypothetical protein